MLPVTAETGYLPDLDRLSPALLARTVAFYLCSPTNPQGAAASLDYLTRALELARRHDFLLIVDECYAEIYTREPPAGALQAALRLGGGFDRLMVFHSLSKRSSAAGLRSGLRRRRSGADRRVRPPAQLCRGGPAAAGAGGGDRAVAGRGACRGEPHPVPPEIRSGRARGSAAASASTGRMAASSCGLTVGDGEAAARRLWTEAALKVLPGAYLGRPDGRGPQSRRRGDQGRPGP